MLARLFRHSEIAFHGGFVNLVNGRTAPISIHPLIDGATFAQQSSNSGFGGDFGW
jgi:hypothetical protein